MIPAGVLAGDSGMDQWMFPLPPEGPIEFFVAWPAEGISEQSTSIDGSELRARAAESEVIQPTPDT